jgi:hypothetical protein
MIILVISGLMVVAEAVKPGSVKSVFRRTSRLMADHPRLVVVAIATFAVLGFTRHLVM